MNRSQLRSTVSAPVLAMVLILCCCSAARAQVGACCIGTSCTMRTLSACENAGGSFEGGSCSADPCGAATGACCAANGTCSIQAGGNCGDFLGAGTTCTSNVCRGSCCASGGTCTLTGPSNCNGAFNGVGSACTASSCPGACCASSCCTTATLATCSGLGGTYIAGTCATAACGAVANDNCSGAIAVTLGSAAVGGNCNATIERLISCASGGPANTHKTVWYRFTPPASAGYEFTTCGSAIDTLLAVHRGDCLSLVEIACNDDAGGCAASGVASRTPGVAMNAGETYYIEVGQWSLVGVPAGGAIRLAVEVSNSFGACCSGAVCTVVGADGCIEANQRYAGNGTSCNAFPTTVPCCPADFNQSGGVSVQDIFDFLSAYFVGDAWADINGGGVSVQDIFDFLTAYFGGC
ncbi:MAG: hypothetical protein IT438_15535 [Phycisphaerales bacterium]|nr:hypothetical protein [Phycisphaerales bacterium]